MVNVYREYAIWKQSKLAREFRENLAGYLESDKPLAITRHGETVGFYIPAQKRSPKAELQAMRAAAKDLDEMIASRPRAGSIVLELDRFARIVWRICGARKNASESWEQTDSCIQFSPGATAALDHRSNTIIS
jgi:hypothetical protein